MSIVEQIARFLAEQGIGVLGTNLFWSYAPDIKSTFDITVIDTTDLAPDIYLPIENPGFQIFIRSTTYDIGYAKYIAIKEALHKNHNAALVVNENFFYFSHLQSGGGIGKNPATGNHEFSQNYHAKVR